MDRTITACIRTRTVWLISSLVIAGCLPYRDRPLSPAQTLVDFESRTLDAEPLAAYLRENLSVEQWPLSRWDLPELTLAAFFYNPQIDVARARWATARGQELTAAERPNPTLSVTPGYNSTTGYGADISPWIVGLVSDIPLETAGKRGYRMAEAHHLSEVARLQLAEAAWDLRRQVRQALLYLYVANRTETLLRSRQGFQQENVTLVEQLFGLGEIPANELSQARVQSDETGLAMLDVYKRQAQARAQIAAAIGVPAGALESIELSFNAFEALPDDVPPVEARRRALLNREDLLAALADYQASQAALQQEVARQYPDIQLGPGYEFDQSENKWMLGLSVTLPVFNRNRGRIVTAEARREEAAATFVTLQARIVSDIEQAVISYRASLRKDEAATALAIQRQAVVDRVRKMYEAGEVVKSEVTAAEIELNASAMNRLDARVEALHALGQIENAMHVAADLADWPRTIQTTRTVYQGNQDHE